MIDNIDVHDCDYLYGDECSAEYSEFNGEIESYAKCSDCADCYFKQLKRKEQELTELRKGILLKCPNCGDEYLNHIGLKLYDKIVKMKEALNEIEARIQLENADDCLLDIMEIIERLKKENEA